MKILLPLKRPIKYLISAYGNLPSMSSRQLGRMVNLRVDHSYFHIDKLEGCRLTAASLVVGPGN